MTRLVLTLLCLLGFVSSVHAEAARRVEVRVVDISGQWAYLSGGTGKGVRPGARVTFGKVERRVERATHSYAVVSARKLRVGARGVVLASAGTKDVSERLPKPRPLAAFEGMWPEIPRPADAQNPKLVPLGRMGSGKGRADATLSTGATAFVPLEKTGRDTVGRAEVRARLNARLAPNFPITFSGDVAAQTWFGDFRSGIAQGDDRPVVRVREFALAIGETGDYRAQVGRLRYAAPNLGPLDGGRVESARWGAFRIAGFGGLLPDPIDNQAALGAGRFGLELGLVGDQLASRPELTLVAQGSVFDGELDERRLYAHMQIWPGRHHLAAYAQLSLFDADNPWGRPQTDFTSAGADADFRFGDVRLGARFDMRRPERSYWLAKSFPTTWLCSTASVGAIPGQPPAACDGSDDTRVTVQGYGGWDLVFMQIDAGGGYTGSSAPELGKSGYGYGTLRFPRVGERYDLALGASHDAGSLMLSNTSVRADLGMGFLDERVRLTLYYRPTYRRYRASLEGLWEQGGGASMLINATPRLSLNAFGDLRLGDVDAALVMLMALVRLGG